MHWKFASVHGAVAHSSCAAASPPPSPNVSSALPVGQTHAVASASQVGCIADPGAPTTGNTPATVPSVLQ